MGEILGLGISHYPPLAGPDERMAFILKLMLKNPKLPESLRDPANQRRRPGCSRTAKAATTGEPY